MAEGTGNGKIGIVVKVGLFTHAIPRSFLPLSFAWLCVTIPRTEHSRSGVRRLAYKSMLTAPSPRYAQGGDTFSLRTWAIHLHPQRQIQGLVAEAEGAPADARLALFSPDGSELEGGEAKTLQAYGITGGTLVAKHLLHRRWTLWY